MASALSPVISGIVGLPRTRINRSQNECGGARRQPFPACGWNPSGGGALFAERELGLELLDHARQCRARPPPVIGLQFRERFFERTALLYDLVEVIDHGRACSRLPVRRRRCRRRPVVAGAGASAGSPAPTVLATIAAPTMLFKSGSGDATARRIAVREDQKPGVFIGGRVRR